MSPLWIAAMLFTASLRKGRNLPDWRLVLAILMGFAGVILLLQSITPASGLAVCSR
jgi:drug/metabolite transporter (DMT)-like permease